MSRFLVATTANPGHVTPASHVVRELLARGHDVRWFTGRRVEAQVRATGARYCAMPEAADWDYTDLPGSFPDRAALRGLKQVQFDLTEAFIKPLGLYLPALAQLLADEPADVFVSNIVFLGGGWLRELGGPPHAIFGDSCLTFTSRDLAPWGMGLAPTHGPIGRLRNRLLGALADAIVFRPVHAVAHQVRAELG